MIPIGRRLDTVVNLAKKKTVQPKKGGEFEKSEHLYLFSLRSAETTACLQASKLINNARSKTKSQIFVWRAVSPYVQLFVTEHPLLLIIRSTSPFNNGIGNSKVNAG